MKNLINRLARTAALCLLATAAHAADFQSDVIRPYDTESWNLTLVGGVSQLIEVEGDGDTDLDAYLYDENGNLVDSDTDGSDYCVLSVTPRWTGRFRLVIENHGSVANYYDLSVTP